jgi:hypothetical protein
MFSLEYTYIAVLLRNAPAVRNKDYLQPSLICFSEVSGTGRETKGECLEGKLFSNSTFYCIHLQMNYTHIAYGLNTLWMRYI